MGKKFKYSEVGEGIQARELQPCLELLERAGIVNKVIKTAGNGIPLGAEANLKFFKILFMDVALCQVLLGLELKDWILDPLKQFVNKGMIVEAFVGQELLAYSDPLSKAELYFWHRDKKGSEAEVDYLIAKQESVIPIEVKSGATGHLKSLLSFLETHSHSPYGIRFSIHNFSRHGNVHSYPLYAIKKALKA